jgi:hypothetical protein
LPFPGIISFVTGECGSNVGDCEIVSVLASNINGSCIPIHIVDFESLLYCVTLNDSNSWISYDFENRRVNVSHYSVRSRSDSDCHHPRTGMVKGSMDGEHRIEFDGRPNYLDLVGVNRTGSFSTSKSEFVRLVVLRQTRQSSSGCFYLMVNAFELVREITVLGSFTPSSSFPSP